MGKYNDKTPNQNGKWVGLVLVLLFTQPVLVIPLAIFGGIMYLMKKSVEQGGKRSSPRTASRYTSRQESFDECPQPFFCFHKDKAEHHVRRGKEIDPWDRPDIDISKYQRRN